MDHTFNSEQWKLLQLADLSYHEHLYISNYGRVCVKNARGQEKLLQPSKIKGYPILNVKLPNGKRSTRYLHKIVAELYLGPYTGNRNYVIHLDYNKDNNHVRNLRWVNKTELAEHQSVNPNYKKGVIRYSKLTETDVIRLKKKLKRGKNPLYKIAKEFGITHTQLNRIRKGENWSHVKVD